MPLRQAAVHGTHGPQPSCSTQQSQPWRTRTNDSPASQRPPWHDRRTTSSTDKRDSDDLDRAMDGGEPCRLARAPLPSYGRPKVPPDTHWPTDAALCIVVKVARSHGKHHATVAMDELMLEEANEVVTVPTRAQRDSVAPRAPLPSYCRPTVPPETRWPTDAVRCTPRWHAAIASTMQPWPLGRMRGRGRT